MKIVFWQDMPSQHQAPAIKALSNLKIGDVYCVFSHELTQDRLKIGWKIPDFGSAILYWIDKDKEAVNGLTNEECIHIFNGLLIYKKLNIYFKKVIKRKRIVIIVAESGWLLGIKKYLARIKWYINLKRFDNSIILYLTFGFIGVQFFRKLGVEEKKIIRYAYQVEIDESNNPGFKKDISKPLKLLFVGQIIKRKGLDILINALHNLEEGAFILDIVGDGPEKKHIEKMVFNKGIEKYITFHGILKNVELGQFFKMHDVLIVPSRHDGWAAVTNEALQCGLPVIISDAAGSSDLIQSTGSGIVFKNGNIKDLREILKSLVKDPNRIVKFKEKIQMTALSISGESIANYLVNLIRYATGEMVQKPQIPWVQSK